VISDRKWISVLHPREVKTNVETVGAIKYKGNPYSA
jgi:hypothetical protein